MQQTIQIKRDGFHLTGKSGEIIDDIDADVEGCFGIHETIPVTLGTWTLTHIPTGYAFLSGVLHGQAVACRAELLAGKIDWSKIASPKDITPAHKRVGKVMRAKYRPVV